MYVCVAVLFVLTRLYVLINMGYTLTYFVPIHCMDANAVLFSRCNNVIWVTEDPRCGDDSLSCIYCADIPVSSIQPTSYQEWFSSTYHLRFD